MTFMGPVGSIEDASKPRKYTLRILDDDDYGAPTDQVFVATPLNFATTAAQIADGQSFEVWDGRRRIFSRSG